MRPGLPWPTRRPRPRRPPLARPGPGPGRTGPGHGAGGQRLALPGASAAARGLARAALAMDDTLMGEIIRAALDRDGVVRTWEDLLVPVLSGIGTRYEHSGECVEAEHLLSAVILAALAGIRRPGRAGLDHRAVLLACAPVNSTASRCTRSRPRWRSGASVPGCSAPTCPTGRWRPLSGAPARPPCSCGRRSPRAGMPGRCRICGRAPVRGWCSAAPAGAHGLARGCPPGRDAARSGSRGTGGTGPQLTHGLVRPGPRGPAVLLRAPSARAALGAGHGRAVTSRVRAHPGVPGRPRPGSPRSPVAREPNLDYE